MKGQKEKLKLSRKEKKHLKKQQKQQDRIQKKKEKQYIPMRGLMGDAEDYNVYVLSLQEWILGFFVGFAGGFLVMYVFFRVWIFSNAAGFAVGFFFIRPFREYLQKKRKRSLLFQFKDMLEALASSYSAGMNTQAAFEDAYQDLLNIYGNNADIVKEVRTITVGLNNNFVIEDLLFDFAKRSGLEDVESFASVFSVCNRQGANLRKIVSETRDIINDKIEAEMDIQTILSGNKNQLNIMMIMPLVIMVSLSSMGNMSAVVNTPVNVVTKLGVLILFGIAYMMGRRIVDIKL